MVQVELPDRGALDVVEHFIEILQVPTSGDIDSFMSKCLWSSERDAEMISVVFRWAS